MGLDEDATVYYHLVPKSSTDDQQTRGEAGSNMPRGYLVTRIASTFTRLRRKIINLDFQPLLPRPSSLLNPRLLPRQGVLVMARQPENAQAGPSRRKWAGSDSEDEPASSPRRPTKRRKTPAEGEDEDDFDDLDDLNSDSDGGIEVLGQPIGNGHANGHANGDEDDEGLSDAPLGEDDMLNGDDVDMVAEGDRGRVEFRPEYQRDKDG